MSFPVRFYRARCTVRTRMLTPNDRTLEVDLISLLASTCLLWLGPRSLYGEDPLTMDPAPEKFPDFEQLAAMLNLSSAQGAHHHAQLCAAHSRRTMDEALMTAWRRAAIRHLNARLQQIRQTLAFRPHAFDCDSDDDCQPGYYCFDDDSKPTVPGCSGLRRVVGDGRRVDFCTSATR